jgi:hypothetical protein
MINDAWIIYENSGRWAAALRTAHRRQPIRQSSSLQLNEVRSLSELEAHVDQQRRHAVTLVEVRRTNLAAILAWLSACHCAQMCCVALLDEASFDFEDRNEVAAVLWSAGAADIIHSPREAERVLFLGRQHAISLVRDSVAPVADQPLVDWARTLLPWQSSG